MFINEETYLLFEESILVYILPLKPWGYPASITDIDKRKKLKTLNKSTIIVVIQQKEYWNNNNNKLS